MNTYINGINLVAPIVLSQIHEVSDMYNFIHHTGDA
jgi:hypothetical protein